MTRPTLGAIVRCPADRGDKAFDGKVYHISTLVNTNIDGVLYVWCSVRRMDGSNGGVWPSHRLGFKLGTVGQPPTLGCLAHIPVPGELPIAVQVDCIFAGGSGKTMVGLKVLGQKLGAGVRPADELMFSA